MTAPSFSWQPVDGSGPAGFGCGMSHHVAGLLDESARRLSHEELRVAETLAGEGHVVKSLRERNHGGREADLEVCGGKVEIKSFQSAEFRDGSPSATSVANKLMDAVGQGDAVVLHGYGSGLTEETVRRGMVRVARHRPELAPSQVRVLGDGFDLSWSKGPVRDAARQARMPPAERQAQPRSRRGPEVGLAR